MTKAELIAKLNECPDEAEIIIQVGEDSRDNPIYRIVSGVSIGTGGDYYDAENLNFLDEDPIIELETEDD